MLQLKDLKHKVALDSSLIVKLRQKLAFYNEQSSLKDKMSLVQLIDEHLNEHLNGIEHQVKRDLKKAIYAAQIHQGTFNTVTYYDIALCLFKLQLPPKQFTINFKNWILMSTEYTIVQEDILSCFTSESNQEPYSENLPAGYLQALEHYTNESLGQQTSFLPSETMDQKNDIGIEALPLGTKRQYRLKPKRIALLAGLILITALMIGQFSGLASFKTQVGFRDACTLLRHADHYEIDIETIVERLYQTNRPGVPEYLTYQNVNLERIKGFLLRSNSLLADSAYFDKIVSTASIQNVNPALLFAIAGQEQGFVKRGSVNAALIVNNPFNVYHSWVEYNTEISDSTKIACRTLNERLASRPAGANPFQWVNVTYAEDPNWWRGTESLFESIEYYIGN